MTAITGMGKYDGFPVKYGMLILPFLFIFCLEKTAAQHLPEMVFVEGGSFLMGNPNGTRDEKPLHTVTLDGFHIGKYPITVAEYREYCTATGTPMPTAPNWGWEDNAPITRVNWHDAVAYCHWLSQKTGKTYRLPTEAEWEYTAGGGNKNAGYIYSGGNDINALGWHGGNAGGKTHPVGLMAPNELGIYDMSGNLFEWCADWFNPAYYAISPAANPKGPQDGVLKILRGGSWRAPGLASAIRYRFYRAPSEKNNRNGFRVVMEISKTPKPSEKKSDGERDEFSW